MKQIIESSVKKVLNDLGLAKAEFIVEHPEEMNHGDFSCNAALVAGGGRELAEKIVQRLKDEENIKKIASEIVVAGPGFINISIQKEAIINQIHILLKDKIKSGSRWGKKVMVEYAHPNTHKQFHIGHLRNISLGESIARLLESVGVEVIRANYQGDVGLHIAKAIWGIKNNEKGYEEVSKQAVLDKVNFLGKVYAEGAKAYEENEKAKKKIVDYNRQIFEGKGAIIGLWQETRQWSLDFFDQIYERMGTKYDRLYFESECREGVEIAKQALEKGILKKSQGAVVFDGSKYGLDTRVFINSEGLPTYEAKELALAPKEFTEFGEIDRLIHVVGPEQKSFFKVTFKVEELIDPKLYQGKQYHKVYAFVKLKKGKMSSREGKVLTGWWLLEEIKNKVKDRFKTDDKTAETVAVGAVKYGFLKVQPASEIAFDIEESINLQGNSGPYLQYTYARCRSVLAKAGKEEKRGERPGKLNSEEEKLLRVLARFEEAVVQAAEEMAPNLVANFLYDVGQKYNAFYHKCPIIKAEENKQFRLWLTRVTGEVLKRGLDILGIKTLEKM